MINLIIFTLFWVAVIGLIWYGFNTLSEGSMPKMSLMVAVLASVLVCFMLSGVVTQIVVKHSDLDAAHVIRVTEIPLQELILPDGNCVKVFATSWGWESDDRQIIQTKKVIPLSDIIVYTPTEDTKFYEVITRTRVTGVVIIPHMLHITTELPTGWQETTPH